MKTIDYYFIKEFQWKHNWFSEFGILKAKIFPTNEFTQHFEYVDYDIIGQIFTSKKEFYNVNFIEAIISEIKKVLTYESTKYIISSEIVLLEVECNNTKPIDVLGDSEGVEGPLSWNISTPIEQQYVPTNEILELFEDWKQFLEEQQNVTLK